MWYNRIVPTRRENPPHSLLCKFVGRGAGLVWLTVWGRGYCSPPILQSILCGAGMLTLFPVFPAFSIAWKQELLLFTLDGSKAGSRIVTSYIPGIKLII